MAAAIEEPETAESRRERVRAEIIAAAERLYAEEGPEGLSMRRLAEAVGYSPAALYKYFANKDALLVAVKELFFGRLLENMGPSSEVDPPTVTSLRACLGAYIQTGLEEPVFYRLAFSEGEGSADYSRAVRTPDTNRGRAYLRLVSVIRRSMKAGVIADGNPDLIAASIWSCGHGAVDLMVKFAKFPLDYSRDAFIAQHIDLLIAGLQNR